MTQNPPPTSTRTVRLVPLPPKAMESLLAGDVAGASNTAGAALSGYLASADCAWLWRIRLDQVARDPVSEHWVARAVISDPDGRCVGHAGFHGPPNDEGMVEVGYAVDPDYRRRGYARAIVRTLLDWAASEDGVSIVRATISPDNVASLATLAGFGFEEVGEQIDEEDGLETIFEVCLGDNESPAH